MMKIILSALVLIAVSGCTHIRLGSDDHVRPEKQPVDINEYIYLETSTGIYNSMKATQDQLSKKETAVAVKKLNAAQGIEYNESTEEKIEKQAAKFMAQGKWKSAFDTLIKYEPVLTHNKNLTNQIIYASLKMEYYDYAIDQLQLALNQNDKMRALNETRQDKEIILAHVYYLSQKYDQATVLYTKLLTQDNFKDASKYLFLVGYKLRDLDAMKNYLAVMGDSHPDATEYSLLTAKVELSKGQVKEARERLAAQFELYPEGQDVVFEYVNVLIESGKYQEALSVLNQSEAEIAETRQYHFMKAYISHQLGDRKSFHRELASTQVEGRYDKLLTNLFLQKHNYTDVYATIFQQGELDAYKFTYLIKEDAEKFTYKYINKPQFKDAILVREEFRSVTEPIRLPSSLEFKPSK
jgi:predicted Zn-dependent protease